MNTKLSQDYITLELQKVLEMLAQEAANDPETRLLLDAKRDLSPEDMQYVISLIKHLKNKNS